MALEEEISRLYGLPLETFTRERNDAARAARKAGQPAEAAAIAELRKPSIVAWTINQLARGSRREVDLLLDSGKRLRDAQRESLDRGDREDLDHARAALEKAVRSLVASAQRLLGGRASDTTLARISETLRNAAITPDGRELLARGTFTQDVHGTGWDVLEDLAATLPPRPETKPSGGREQTGQRRSASSKAELEETRAALRAAQSRRREAARGLREAERRKARARQALDAADADVDAARRALIEAEDELERVQRGLPGRP